MIAIINIDPDPRPTGPHRYELRINAEVIATFKHNREHGLAACLRKAADAAELAQCKQAAELLQGLREKAR